MPTDEEGARGTRFHVGRSSEITILELAETVIERTGSSSGIQMVAYEEATVVAPRSSAGVAPTPRRSSR